MLIYTHEALAHQIPAQKSSLSLSLSHSRLPKTLAISTLIFLLCLCTGIIAGSYIKKHTEDTNAASSNITVTNNNQVITHDQGAPTITRTSTVTVKDVNAEYGYTLYARIASSSISGATVEIIKSTGYTAPCGYYPCTLTAGSTPKKILETTSSGAATPQGATTDFTVTITLPANTPVGNYQVDIEYTEEPYAPPCPVLDNKTYLQDITAPSSKPYGTPGQRVVLKDRRNNQDYYVQNILSAEGTECVAWMETNLRYGGDGNWDASWGYLDDRYATTAANAANTWTSFDDVRRLRMTSSPDTMAYDYAEMVDPGGSTTLDTTTPTNNTTFYGYLYNWCAAMGGQYGACNDTMTPPNQTDDIITNISICPAGWRLPVHHDYYEGIDSFHGLNNVVNGGLTDTASGLRDNWLGVYSGAYSSDIFNQGSSGKYWTSYIGNAEEAYVLYFADYNVYSDSVDYKNYGVAVRCIL